MKRDRLVLAAAAVAVLVLLAQLVDFGYGRDQGIYAVAARALRDGGLPYRDAWDFKPPGIFFVYAAAGAMFGDGVHAVRWLEALALVSMVGAFADLSRLYLGDARPGLVGGALAVVTYVQMEFWHTGQPESFGAVAVAWMLVCAARAMRDDAASRPALWWTAAGACAGAAFLLKPTVGVAAGAPIVLALTRRSGASGRARLSVLAPFAAAGAAVVAACAAVFWWRGGLGALGETLFVFAPQYASLAWRGQSVGVQFGRLASMTFLAFPWVNPLGLVFLAAGKPAGRAREGIAHVALAAALLLGGVLAQGRFYAYHFGAALPLIALLSGWGWWALWLRLRPTWHGAAAVAALFVLVLSLKAGTFDLRDSFLSRCRLRFVAWTEPGRRQVIRDRLYSVVDYWAPDNRRVSEWVRAHTAPGARLFVYGFTPEIYAATGRPLSSRYIYDVPLRAAWSRDAARAELLDDFRAGEPDVVIVEHGDTVARVTGAPGDSAADFARFDALRDLVAADYAPEPRIGKFDVYTRKR